MRPPSAIRGSVEVVVEEVEVEEVVVKEVVVELMVRKASATREYNFTGACFSTIFRVCAKVRHFDCLINFAFEREVYADFWLSTLLMKNMFWMGWAKKR